MRKIVVVILFSFTLASAVLCQTPNGVEVDRNGPALSEAQQKTFLSTRLPSGQFGGTFSSWGSALFALQRVAIHTVSSTVAESRLGTPFPNYYHPTWREEFDSIAIQTGSNWKYDGSRDYWVFSAFPMLPSYKVTLADGWKSHDEGIYVGFTPPTAPTGMDIYRMGTYSADSPEDEAKLFEKVRGTLALRFASAFDRAITVDKMQPLQIDNADALYFECEAPAQKDLIWRQWVVVKNGKAFVIVSSLDKSDTKLLEDVRGMVKSFQIR